MKYHVLYIWVAYFIIFTLMPMLLVSAIGPHPVFYRANPVDHIQIVSSFMLILGACIPVFIKRRRLSLNRIFGVTMLVFKLLTILFIVSHCLIANEYDLDFRHRLRISQMGILGYFYALEQVMIIPFTFFLLRLSVLGRYQEISKYRFFLTIYALILVLLPFNFFNLLCGAIIIIILYMHNFLAMKIGIVTTMIWPIIAIVALVGSTLLIKGDGLENLEAVARYLQYRISIWYVSVEILANMPWQNRLSVFSQSFFDEASINTNNAKIIFNSLFANPRVGAGPGIVGSSLYLLPFPINLLLVTLYGFMLSFLLKCSGIFQKEPSILLLIATFCLLFPFLGGGIQYASFELIPLAGLFLFTFTAIVKIPMKPISHSSGSV